MLPRPTNHATVLASALLLLAVSTQVQAHHDPVHSAEEAVGPLLEPFGTPFLGTIVIEGASRSVASVWTSPGLSCTTADDTVAGVVTVECVPEPEGDWICLGPVVVVTTSGGQGSVEGSAGCADGMRSCTAHGLAHAPGLLPACIGFGLWVQDFPMRCQADYDAAGGLESWSVACGNGDP